MKRRHAAEHLESASCQPRDPLHNPWLILGVLFLAAGVLGIPLLWVSHAFSTPTKILLTIAVTLYTLLMLWAIWLIVVWGYQQMMVV